MKPYDHLKIEKKWQKEWEKKKLDRASDTSKKKKWYSLIEFPYPSGDGLHVGHIRSNTAMDIVSRKRRMEGYNVLYPIGWDAFGLPTENYAIKTGIQPSVVTKKNTDTFRRQLKTLGFSFDWAREVNTTDPKYYKWTQWIFLQFLKKGLAYKKRMAINWCPKDKIGLANEEVVNGKCERCGTAVEKREKEQWMLAITKYADRLDKDLDTVDFLEKIKIQQRNWIGRSEGVNLSFKVKDTDLTLEMYDSIPQTYMAQTFTVIAPDHPLLPKIVAGTPYEKTVLDFAKRIVEKRNSGADHTKDIEGIFTGRSIEYTPANRQLPIWVASYAVADYGTGIVNCSAHDERDFAFAKKYHIPLHPVLFPKQSDIPKEIFLATNNQTKKERVIKFLKASNLAIKVTTPKDLGIPSIEVKEDASLLENAERKARAYVGKVSLPILATDTGFEIDGEDLDPTRPKRNALAGISEKDLSQKEIAEKMIAYYRGIAKKHGGEVPARWKDSWALVMSDGSVRKAEAYRSESILTDTIHGEIDLFMPIRCLYKVKATGKPANLLTYEEEMVEMKPAIEAVASLFGNNDLANKIKSTDVFYREPNGILEEPAEFKGRRWDEARQDIIDFLAKKGWAERKVNYKLRDWVFSRQRYWGEPIPVVHCEKCGIVPVPEKELPIKLPAVKNYKPTDTGESPLAAISKWVNTKCPKCKAKGKRETDTMPNWAGSSWYFLRYIDPKNPKAFADKKKLKYWTPVDWYNGGMEHTTLHLLYSRFWHKFLFDLGLVPTSEPYQKRTSHGLILAEGGVKMSKSIGNVINPDDLVKTVGADSLRLYEMFMGPFDQAIAWDTKNIAGCRRFIERAWKLQEKVNKKAPSSAKISSLVNQTVKKVSADIEAMKFNTAISSLMILVNEFEKETSVSSSLYEKFVLLISPFIPHVAEELWLSLGHTKSVFIAHWPTFDEKLSGTAGSVIVIQVNGKVRASFETDKELSENEVKEKALALPDVMKWVGDTPIKKVVFIKGRLLNLVI
jgi:leucyl-tRNA synthetase